MDSAQGPTSVEGYTKEYAFLVPISLTAQKGMNEAVEGIIRREEEHRYRYFTKLYLHPEGISKLQAVGRLSLSLPPKDPQLGWTIGTGLASDIPIAVSPNSLYHIATVHAALNLHPQTGLWTVTPATEHTIVFVKNEDEWFEVDDVDGHCFTEMDEIFRLGYEADDLVFQLMYVVPERYRLDFFWQRHEYMQQHLSARYSLPDQILERYPYDKPTDLPKTQEQH